MDKLVGLIKKAPKSRDYNDDDVIDRLSSRYTVVMLICFSLLVSMNQYVRNPITCMIPHFFRGDQSKFATSYCWVKNTYYLAWTTLLEQAGHNPNKQTIAYYQWIPFVLVAQAVLFYLPSVIWHNLNSRSGVDADNILEAAHTFSMTDKVETRDRTMKMLVQQIHRFLKSHVGSKKRKRRSWGMDRGICGKKCSTTCVCCGRKCVGTRIGNYLVIIFLTSKLFYLLNIFGQLYLLGRLLSTNFFYFGIDLLSKMIEGSDWTNDLRVVFPRETICEFNVIGMDATNRHNYTVQCVLPVNMYNEKIYLFLWCWLLFLAFVTSVSFLVWLLRCLCSPDRERFVRNHILDATGVKKEQKQNESQQQQQQQQQQKRSQPQTLLDTRVSQNSGKLSIETVPSLSDTTTYGVQVPPPIRGADFVILIPSEEIVQFNKRLKDFCRNYLMQDGELLLRLIAHNTDHVTTTEVIFEVWKNWLDLVSSKKKGSTSGGGGGGDKKSSKNINNEVGFDSNDGSKKPSVSSRTKNVQIV